MEYWDRLAALPPGEAYLDPSAIEVLPVPVQRMVRRAVPARTLIAHAVLLSMEGQIRVGRWIPFRAVQVLSRRGFVWVARAGWRTLSIGGFDRWIDGVGEMRWLLGGSVPIIRSSGPDVSRSAAGRLAIEATIWLPTNVPSLEWRAGMDDETAVATWRVGSHDETVELRLDGDGRPREVSMQRWGNPDREPFARHPFGGLLEDEATFGAVTIPTSVRVGWWWGTARWREGEFFRARITDAVFL